MAKIFKYDPGPITKNKGFVGQSRPLCMFYGFSPFGDLVKSFPASIAAVYVALWILMFNLILAVGDVTVNANSV